MKKSMIVMMMMMMMMIVFSVNLFGEMVNEKAADHVCTTECKHEEVEKKCEPDCTKPCCANKNIVKDHVCTEKCEIVKNHVCTSDCKLDETSKTCEIANIKNACLNSAAEQGCKPVGCGEKIKKKSCH